MPVQNFPHWQISLRLIGHMGNIQLEIELFGCLKRQGDIYIASLLWLKCVAQQKILWIHWNEANHLKVWSLPTDVNMYYIKEGLCTREINVLSNGEYLEKA